MSGTRRSAWAALTALALTLVVSVYYLMTGVLQVRPLGATYQVTVQLSESGGLLPNQDVTMRGVRVGKVEHLAFTPDGVEAVLRVADDVQIPASSSVRVSALSAAGEQYVDFAATSEDGPYLADGAVISRARTAVPVPMAELLAHADGVLAQVDPQKLERVKAELSVSGAGPEKLSAIVDGGMFLLSTLDSVLPETVDIIRSSRVVLSSAVDVNSGIAATATNLRHTMAGVAGMQDGYRELLGGSPATLGAIDGLFTDNSDTMVQLLGSMATMSHLFYLRVPALNALFPDYRGSVLDAVTSAFHDGGVWATADLYPRYVCDYGTPSHAPSAADYYEPFMYTYCRDDDPAVSIRGAKNAPRPGGDDTAGPPPGANLGQRTDPTPRGRYTIPTPYGGPQLPIEPPH